MFEEKQSTKIGRFTVVQGEVLRFGTISPYSFLRKKACVCILPLLKDRVIYIRQYRYAIGKWCLELPCGAIEIGEDPETAARRELREETGCIPQRLIFLGECFARAGISDCRVYYYLAECEDRGEQELDSTEQIELQSAGIREFDDMIRDGAFSQLMGIVCWQRAEKQIVDVIKRQGETQ